VDYDIKKKPPLLLLRGYGWQAISVPVV